MGIGPVPAGMDPADFVLGGFSKAEHEAVESMISGACMFIEAMLEKGMEKAVSQLQGKE